LEIHHACRNKLCVNPTHLETITHALHMRIHARPCLPKPPRLPRTHCKRGEHEWIEANIRRGKNGYRCCKPCQNRKMRLWTRSKYGCQPRIP
jgi:hypothetical protein